MKPSAKEAVESQKNDEKPDSISIHPNSAILVVVFIPACHAYLTKFPDMFRVGTTSGSASIFIKKRLNRKGVPNSALVRIPNYDQRAVPLSLLHNEILNTNQYRQIMYTHCLKEYIQIHQNLF